ncbi:MAG: hypothetical protein AAFP03_01100 [Cyanobacteria bacterium J06598_3]
MRRNALKLSSQAKLLVGLTTALWIHSAAPTQAHGAKIEVSPQAVEIIATFDTGEPMDNAQVAVYAPDMLDTPWQTGQTDSEGRFLFTPDSSGVADSAAAGGLWEVTVRKAGHGQTTSFALEDVNSRATTTATAHSPIQKWLSIAAIIWGFIGTALFFSSKNRKGNGHPKSTDKTAGEPALEAARTLNNRAAIAARFGDNAKTTAEDYR